MSMPASLYDTGVVFFLSLGVICTIQILLEVGLRLKEQVLLYVGSLSRVHLDGAMSLSAYVSHSRLYHNSLAVRLVYFTA